MREWIEKWFLGGIIRKLVEGNPTVKKVYVALLGRKRIISAALGVFAGAAIYFGNAEVGEALFFDEPKVVRIDLRDSRDVVDFHPATNPEVPQALAIKVADTVIVAVGKGLDVKLVDDGVLVPERVGDGVGGRHPLCSTAAIRIQRIDTVDRKGDAGVGALGGLRFFVHGDATAMEMTPPFV